MQTSKVKILLISLALEQIREVGMVTKQGHVSKAHGIECSCKIQWYTIFMLSLSLLGIIISSCHIYGMRYWPSHQNLSLKKACNTRAMVTPLTHTWFYNTMNQITIRGYNILPQ